MLNSFNILNIFGQQYSMNGIVSSANYCVITLGSIYCVFQREYLRSKILSIILSLSFSFYIIGFVTEANLWQFGARNFTENPYFQFELLFNCILLVAILMITVNFKNRAARDGRENSKLSAAEPILIQDNEARIAAEGELAKLQTELEQKVSEKTAALSIANHDLRESASLMEKVANLTPNILYVYDLEKQYNVYSNCFVQEILDYSEAEIEEKNIQLFGKLLHPEDRHIIAKHHQNCLELSQDDCLEVEYRMQDREGNWHWLHSKDTVFERNEAGKPTQILGIIRDITETKKIQSESARLNAELAKKVNTLEQWHSERIKLARMNEFLQACVTIEEAKTALTDLLQPLFPNTHGAIYLMNNSKNLLDAIAAWGIPNSESSFEPQECWALRRGNYHQAQPHTPGLYCTHVDSHSHTTSTLCLPMIAKGKTLGMLYLRFIPTEQIGELIQELAESVAQNIAMSFANLKLQEKLRYQSLRDPLTGLYNRRYLQESLVKEIDRANRKQQFIGIIMLDVDHFKRFNDIYGHSAGDLVLKEVGAYLMSQIRQYDLACRYGGEELVVVMPDASIGDTVMRAEDIRNGISQLSLVHDGQKLEPVTVSIGVSCFPDDGINADELISSADKALYQAKEQGRDRVQRC